MNSIADDGDDIVSFPVPKRYLPVVIHALSRAMETGATSAPDRSTTNQTEWSSTAKIDWSDQTNARKLRSKLNIKIAVALLDMAAEAAVRSQGSSITFEEVYNRNGAGDIRGERTRLGALTKIIKREFGVTNENTTWPVTIQYGSNGEASYCMPPEVAKAWIDSDV